MSINRFVALGLVFIFLVGAVVLYLQPQTNREPSPGDNRIAKRLDKQYRVTGAVLGHTPDTPLEILYLTGYDPVTENFSSIYMNGENLIYSPSFARKIELNKLYSALPREDFVAEISTALEIELDFWIYSGADELKLLIDELGGIKLDTASGDTTAEPEAWLDGQMSMKYVRDAESNLGTKDLRRRHKRLFLALTRRLQRKNHLTNSRDFVTRLRNRIETNLKDGELELLVDLLADLEPPRTKFFHAFPGKIKNDERIDAERVGRMLPRRVQHKIETTTNKEVIEVQIFNGTGIPGLASKLRKKLRKREFLDVVEVGNAERFDYKKTRIIDRVDHPRSAHRIKNILGTGELRLKPSTEALADVKLIVGKDIQEFLKTQENTKSE